MSSSVSCDGCRVIPWPTLLIQTSTRPNREIASSTTRRTCDRSDTSATMAYPRPRHCAATRSSSFLRRATIAIEWPCAARGSAAAAPIPALAPVITMIFSLMIASSGATGDMECVDLNRRFELAYKVSLRADQFSVDAELGATTPGPRSHVGDDQHGRIRACEQARHREPDRDAARSGPTARDPRLFFIRA